MSETGPPHDKTFTWSLRLGEGLETVGTANSKKLAKNRAAEVMVRKLDSLPRYEMCDSMGKFALPHRINVELRLRAMLLGSI